MWPVPPSLTWDPSRSHSASTRLEVWSGGEQLSKDAEIITGSVTERWVTGPRSSLTLSVPPTSEWLGWFESPLIELRPFSVISLGTEQFECPMGRFRAAPPALSLPTGAVSITADDQWQVVVQNDLIWITEGPAGNATALAAQIITDSGVADDVLITTTRVAWAPPLMWDKPRSELVATYLDPIGAEAFVDRLGQVIIRDRLSSPGSDLTDGDSGTVVSITTTPDWSKVVNVVGATSSKNDVVIPVQVAEIGDWGHPAHRTKIGRRTYRYTSQLITTIEEAQTAAWSQLAKLSAPALSWSAQCVPDPTRMPGDELTVTTGLGSVRAVVQEVTHPLGGGAQKVTLGAAL